MVKKVTILDDTLCQNVIHVVTPRMREQLAMIGQPLPDGLRFFTAKDECGRMIQEPVTVKRVFEGRHLEIAVKRAKRWMHNRRKTMNKRPPRHIALAMAAFHKIDPKGFDELSTAS